MSAAPSHTSGRIITFYSYKGGTGRSMMLANVAWILASVGRRVLVVDWDLEAPGLHRYFMPFLSDPLQRSSDGIIDLVIAYASETLAPDSDKRDPDWIVPHANILRYAASLEWKFPAPGTLDFVGAGRQGTSYATRVNTFDWRAFYEAMRGGEFIDAACDSMRKEYDYVLIDSRTGVSDTSGICTVQMPDALVVCFTLNNQSIEGASAIVASVLSLRKSNPPEIYPVPMRVDTFEKEKCDRRMDLAMEKLGLLPARMSADGRRRYWGEVATPYVPFYAYEEVLAPFVDRPDRTSSVLAPALRIAAHAAEIEVRELPPLAEEVRRDVILRYAGQSATSSSTPDLVRAADQALERLDKDGREHTLRALTRLVQIAPTEEGGRSARIRLPQSELGLPVDVMQTLLSKGVLQVQTDASSNTELIELTSDSLVNEWTHFEVAVQQERELILWRQHLRSYLTDWRRHPENPGALLRGTALDAARRWKTARPADLTKEEQTFVEASLAASKRRRGWRIAFAATAVISLVAAGTYLYFDYRHRSAVEWVARADQLVERGALEDAKYGYERAIFHDPKLASAHYGLGTLLAEQSDYAGARASFTRALSIRTDTLFYLARANASVQEGKYADALVDYDSLLRMSPSAATYFERAQARVAVGDTAQAIVDYGRVLALDAGHAAAAFNRGVLFALKGDRPAALADFRYVVGVSSDSLLAIAATARIRNLDARAVPARRPRYEALLVEIRGSAADRTVIDYLRSALRASGYGVQVTSAAAIPATASVSYLDSRLSWDAGRIARVSTKALADRGYPVELPVFSGTASEVPDSGLVIVRLPQLGSGAIRFPRSVPISKR
jgi:tetratricopeptide (TPR) repeat protein/cellulose biosynthesis protein BcsQ